MKEIKVDFKKFDYGKFEQDMLNFAEEIVDPHYAVAWIEDIGDAANYDSQDESERNYLDELQKDGKLLYFSFSDTNVGEPISCANGERYLLNADEFDQNEEDDDEYKSVHISYSDFGIGEGDTIGYLLKLNNGILTINSAYNFGGACTAPPPSITIEGCDIFDKPMEEYIRRYINN